MTTTVLSPATVSLSGYLRSIGGCDEHVCVDAAGEPDPLAARRLAEILRARHAADLDVILSVVQSAHRVRVTLLDDVPLR